MTAPWDRLQVIRERREAVLAELNELTRQEDELTQECHKWLYNTPGGLLTPKETRLLSLMQQNPTALNKELADQLGVTERTVKDYLTHMYAKFRVAGRRDMLRKAGVVPQENT